MNMRAVIDRFEETYAVVLVGPQEVELHIPKEELPPECKEGSVLLMGFSLDIQGEVQQREKVGNLLEKLKRKHLET
nr:DUF3006 domain-containing protein [uncultured Sphaerochaeta sp.]